jgi:hypothetical protein
MLFQLGRSFIASLIEAIDLYKKGATYTVGRPFKFF